MSELKDYKVYTTRNEGAWGYHYEPNPNKDTSDIELNGEHVYLKRETDKVIAEKDEKIDELEERIDELQKATDSAWSKVNAMYDELRHNKRKRCLDKAAMCKARYDAEDAKVNGCGASWEYINEEMKYWERWSWYWEALAEEPTWAKFLQLVHKEAK